MLGWWIEARYYGRFIGEHRSSKSHDAWWTWSCLVPLLPSGNNFYPFREVIRYGQDESISSGCQRNDRSDNIHSPHLKWPWGGCWMKTLQRLMNKVTVDLTCMTSLSVGDGIRDHLRPIIAKSSEPVSELGYGLMSSAHTIMSFFKCFLCLFVWKTLKRNFIIRSAI